jgi:hypothetical protein
MQDKLDYMDANEKVYAAFKDYIWTPEIIKSVWMTDGQEIWWNSLDSEEDLRDGVGHTFSVEIVGGPIVDDTHYSCVVRDCCGEISQMIFKLSKKVPWDEGD